MKKHSGWQDFVLMVLPMALSVFPRVATLSLTMAILPRLGFYIIFAILLIVCASCGAYYKMDAKKTFIGAVSTLFAPCMILHDHSKFFYVANYTVSAPLTLLSCALPLLVYFKTDLEEMGLFNKVCIFCLWSFLETE